MTNHPNRKSLPFKVYVAGTDRCIARFESFDIACAFAQLCSRQESTSDMEVWAHWGRDAGNGIVAQFNRGLPSDEFGDSLSIDCVLTGTLPAAFAA
ncbi:MAG: hypothetical protein NVS1B6_15870 [Steroidobacteraceae bacterium]